MVSLSDDPIFQKYYEKFIRALAKDFNDPDKVQFVSGSGFGKWGEYHSDGTIRCVSWENRSCRLVRLFSIG